MGASPPHSPQDSPPLTSVEICAGAGGQAVGLHKAGFEHRALVEWDSHAVETLKANVRNWPWWDSGKAQELKSQDVNDFLESDQHKGLELGNERLSLLAAVFRALRSR
ncbi:DNA cytosine methyltransferase [Streptomyces indonesiensis]